MTTKKRTKTIQTWYNNNKTRQTNVKSILYIWIISTDVLFDKRLICFHTWNMWSWSSVCSAWDSLFEFCAFSAKIWAHQNANPPTDRRFMANSLEIASTSPYYVHALTDSLKAPYPTTSAFLIPPSLPSWCVLRCPTFGVVIGFLFCLPLLIFSCFFCCWFLCLYDAIRPLGCDVMLIK